MRFYLAYGFLVSAIMFVVIGYFDDHALRPFQVAVGLVILAYIVMFWPKRRRRFASGAHKVRRRE
ncbi:MAG: hypothetical protein A3C70_01255 [Candidatus Zambryskibacteria bacterium RIFCSPHIGHO2_02_FULL_43_14]|uniref:Uncharacterized protein n=1 Tax=Candidatus Zambryskibacteria bacterium RIFCSPHIGHO2_02_FULL_43_14 TaxID=1802748 RepID=A0A1G2TFG5_9BACT|nr:MAG: hypothetical protein A2829_02535 [Candidatus Zambryskibacteria bacterium RIFCSPHIGHO2_01_FULL_43_60]OHA95798.1 MAG: hypothetical protein A3C70_01255 [Candidatus Zambryskibacteria bacterium RIFCSPHIGHO2_02_FULL_43_14]OHB03241.1 MAG: hypothetical protein A3B03_02500 [Candidatus Zambryskibacteria bacterium RIFCSPLOWO2_01_FULL_42_41]